MSALIALFAPISGAHFNPAVALGFCLTRSIAVGLAAAYAVVQVLGAVVGVTVANLTFGIGMLSISDRLGAASVGLRPSSSPRSYWCC